MAARTTRRKIQDNARKLRDDLDRMEDRLAIMAALSQGNHPWVEENNAVMMALIDEFRKVVDHFYAGI